MNMDNKNETTWFNYRPLSKSSTYEVLPDTRSDRAIRRPKTTHNTSRSGLQLSNWTLEIWSAILSICALAALIAVLVYANGAVVHAWHGITLNAVVSALATISKLAATYVAGAALAQKKWCLFRDGPQSLNDFEAIDLASRGVSGCFALLWRAHNFALIGVYALILATIFDPFAQQLVHYQSDVLYSQSNDVTIPRATKYSAGNRIVVTSTDLGGGPQVIAYADYLIQSAVASALVLPKDDIVQQLKQSCRSGNCTWPAFESLAVCSLCNNVHSYLGTTQSQDVLLSDLSLANLGSELRASNFSRPTLPNGLTIDDSVSMTTLGTSARNGTVSMGGVDTLIWSMTVLKAKSQSHGESFSDYEAYECALRYCVQSYDSKVVDNQVQESTTLIRSATRNPGSWQVTGQDRLDFYTGGTSTSLNNTVTNAELNSLDANSPVVGIDRSDLMLGDKYNISQTAVDSISSLMYQTFSVEARSGINGWYIDGAPGDVEYSPSSINQLWHSQSLNERFETLAISMTNAIRANSDNKAIETGQEGNSVTKFRIVWPWIALPLIVILASLAQLFIVIPSSRDIPLWKESTLAVLSRGKQPGDLLDQASTVQEMRGAANRANVNLLEEKTELRSLTPSTFGRVDTEYRS